MILFDISKDNNSLNGDCFLTEFAADGSGQPMNVTWGKFQHTVTGLYDPAVGQVSDPVVNIFVTQELCVSCRISEVTVSGSQMGDYSQFAKNFSIIHLH